jgi:hypothetical protein
LLGQRCPRDRWGDRDLKQKDEYEEQVATPAQVRTKNIDVEPIPIPLETGGTGPKASRGRAGRGKMSTPERKTEVEKVKRLKAERRAIQQEDSRRIAAKREELNKAAEKEFQDRKRLAAIQRQKAQEEVAAAKAV